jgi:hypothetical protein
LRVSQALSAVTLAISSCWATWPRSLGSIPRPFARTGGAYRLHVDQPKQALHEPGRLPQRLVELSRGSARSGLKSVSRTDFRAPFPVRRRASGSPCRCRAEGGCACRSARPLGSSEGGAGSSASPDA